MAVTRSTRGTSHMHAPAPICSKQSIARVRRHVWAHYKQYGRTALPWRKTTDPYHILVSEVMLQQTQVNRVAQAYPIFLKRFPTLTALTRATPAEVLVAWQGLGYNRRARALHSTARMLSERYGGTVPCDPEVLRTLPGVGPYTADAVCVFAFNRPLPLIETNIRTVIFHELLQARGSISDHECLQVAAQLLVRGRPREWHWALMDYGASLKESGVRLNMQSKHYVKQATFKGSDREVRGAIIRALARAGTLSCTRLAAELPFALERTACALRALVRDELVTIVRGKVSLPPH